MATDRVANAISETYQLTYDYLPRRSRSTRSPTPSAYPDGRVVAEKPEVEISIDVSDEHLG